MVESNFSFKSADSMVQLLCLLDKESKILPKMTLSRTKCGYYLQGPARVDTYLICPELAVNIYYELMKIVFFLLYNGGKWP